MYIFSIDQAIAHNNARDGDLFQGTAKFAKQGAG